MARILPRRWSQKIPPDRIPNESPRKAVGITRRGEPWSDASIRHRLSALAALFEYLCDRSAVTHNPVKGVSRPKSESGKGKTPALGDHQARELLAAPLDDSIRSKRDRALLSTLLFHALRREELCKLKVKDFRHARKGVPHLKVSGKAARRATCRCIPAPMRSFTNTLRPRATAKTTAAPFSGQSATTRRARQGNHAGRRLQAGARLFGGSRLQDRGARAAGDCGDECARS
jgi:site-specific recombinase XerC